MDIAIGNCQYCIIGRTRKSILWGHFLEVNASGEDIWRIHVKQKYTLKLHLCVAARGGCQKESSDL
jgi:hypothetical protein